MCVVERQSAESERRGIVFVTVRGYPSCGFCCVLMSNLASDRRGSKIEALLTVIASHYEEAPREKWILIPEHFLP